MKNSFLQRGWNRALCAVGLVVIAAFTQGCTTDAYCFTDCGGTTGGVGGGTTSAGPGQFTSGSDSGSRASSSSGGCVPTNGGIEICDGIDNDCNGLVDDGIDFENPAHCGTCANNCFTKLLHVSVDSITCSWDGTEGEPGTCSGTCEADFYDLDGSGSCEYGPCTPTGADDTCDGLDNDCDGQVDNHVDLCTSTTDCGSCGHHCTVLHGTAACVSTGSPGDCDASNTQCVLQGCTCNGPGDCWWRLPTSPANACDYQCDKTSPFEICGDGVDNDCNGKIDGADDTSQDPQIGIPCCATPNLQCGNPSDGECGNAALHQGVTKCVGDKVVCVGPNVLHKGDLPETCDGLDNDCDGIVDNAAIDVGGACGVTNKAPCRLGTIQCVAGAPACVGNVDPQPEICNGRDDNCDGFIDRIGLSPPPDSIGPCNVRPPPPPGATSPCTPGSKACVGGVVQCLGGTGPTSPTDTCGVDANCDGVLDNQPDLQTDVHNCGVCGRDCMTGSVHANVACVGGTCQFQSCQAGWWDLTGSHQCTYACDFVSAQEACNGKDDNCDGKIDENVPVPAASQVCGTSPLATTPECIGKGQGGLVDVKCVAGGGSASWTCAFPPGVCNGPGGCAGTPEVCEDNGLGTGGGVDNNCNGQINENVPNWGKPCASDDGKAPPGDGACRTTGHFRCTGASSVACNATKDLSKVSQEICDGIDNDCDGSVDEPFSNNPGGGSYVKPAVAHVGPTSAPFWIYAYEASRPSATSTSPGTGNGYFCAAFDSANPNCNDAAVPVAPAGVQLGKTPSCSVQGKIPWFNVTPAEAEQTCKAQGGHLCTDVEWQHVCETRFTGSASSTTCTWGYSPRSAAGCQTASGAPPTASGHVCNLGATFDFDAAAAGLQSGLLVTGSPALTNCYADWSGLDSNSATRGLTANSVFDLTGNLREITKNATDVYPLMGGSFQTADESGATCTFSFYTADHTFQLYDLGFRCCFSSNPD